MESGADAPITTLLARWQAGDAAALDALAPLVYAQLQHIAQRQLRRERVRPLSATELVNEACLRLITPDISWNDRAHFFAVAARQMRRVLLDEARRRARDKRGGGLEPVTLSTDIAADDGAASDVLALDDALHQLHGRDPRKAQVVELHYFGGLDYAAIAAVLGVSEATVDRDLRFAKAWLKSVLLRD